MAHSTWYVELRTWRRRPLLDDERTRDLFARTLSVLEAAGRLTVRAASVQPTTARLVVTTDRDGPVAAADLASTTERLMQLACRTTARRFWDEHFHCRPLTDGEAEGFERLLTERREPCRPSSGSVFSSLI